MSLIHNERTKLLANALDRASTACLTIGVVAPAAAVLNNLGGPFLGAGPLTLVATMYVWLYAAALLHAAARRTLKGLTPS